MTSPVDAEELLALAFEDVPEVSRLRLAAASEFVQVAPGSRIVAEGDPADALHVVAQGTVQLSVHQRQHQHVVATLGTPEVLGWSWLVPPNRWVFDAASTGGATLLRVPSVEVLSLMTEDARFGAALSTAMVAVVSRRLRDTRLQLLDLYSANVSSGQQ